MKPAGPLPGHPTPVQYMRGIGPKRAEALATVGVFSVPDLLFYVPRRYLDRSSILTIAELRRRAGALGWNHAPHAGSAGGEMISDRGDVTVVGSVRSFRVAGAGRASRFVLVLADATGSMQCVWFGGVQYWKRAFEVGERIAVSGRPSLYGGTLQFVHPEVDRISPRKDEEDRPDEEQVDWEARLHTGGLVPLYPSTQELSRVGLDSAGFRRVIRRALSEHLQALRDPLPANLLRVRELAPLDAALQAVHFPRSGEELQRSLRRLKYEEFFRFQLKLALKRRWLKTGAKGIAYSVTSTLARGLVDRLPFALTTAQKRAIREITDDMQLPRPMNRLLQGDVGSGKTIVALAAMLIAVDNGYQAVFMAPTEILAEQHYRTLVDLTRDLPVSVRLLVGAQKSVLRRDVLEDIRRGGAGIVVGTHALFEKEVEFARLGFVVIDEQHRFGVMQRAAVRAKGENPDVLVMTATPIPRTLSLTLYGDLDLSVIDELPAGRRPITTVLREENETKQVYAFVREQVRLGRQAYFVYPLIEESEKVDLKAATVHFQELRDRAFPDLRLGLIHGRMGTDEKESVMHSFKRGDIQILVATTVIEVGIDVPNATVMVIENAERFGLSQLHQLRGRVGRGAQQSYCILLAGRWAVRGAGRLTSAAALEADELRRQAERRLATMVRTTDGFRIAEEDLQIRGPGDFFGTRQSGVPEFRVANILTDGAVLGDARSDAFAIVDADPHLSLPEHRLLADELRSRFLDELALLRAG